MLSPPHPTHPHALTPTPPLPCSWRAAEEVQRKGGGKVLVHCMSGLSRSPAVVIYYLMRRNSWRLRHAGGADCAGGLPCSEPAVLCKALCGPGRPRACAVRPLRAALATLPASRAVVLAPPPVVGPFLPAQQLAAPAPVPPLPTCCSEAYRWVKDRRPVIAITQVRGHFLQV